MQVHVRYNGLSYDIDFEEAGLAGEPTDTQVREAVARYVEAPVEKFRDFQIDRNSETGDITVRPQASFGAAKLGEL